MNNGQLAKELTPACRVSLTRWLPLVLALAIQAVCFSSYAVEFHDHDDILAVAEKLVLKLPEIAELNQPYVSMDRLDSRLRLKQCSQPLRAEPSPGGVRSGKTTIAVHCYGNQPWRLYVPAKVESIIDTVKLTRSLPRGAVLSVSDISLSKSRRSHTSKPLINSIKEAQGAALRRALARGTELTQSMLEAPLILKVGIDPLRFQSYPKSIKACSKLGSGIMVVCAVMAWLKRTAVNNVIIGFMIFIHFHIIFKEFHVQMHRFCYPGAREHVKMHRLCYPGAREHVKMHTKRPTYLCTSLFMQVKRRPRSAGARKNA